MPIYRPQAHFCEKCGTAMQHVYIQSEGHMRDQCPQCGYIRYFNPLPIVGCVPVYKDKVLLARRAIAPRIGYWTLPAGFMELHERLSEGAERETLEETGASVKAHQLFTVFDIVHGGQITFFFLAQMLNDTINPGPESLEARLFSEDEIPWDDIAFSTIRETLKHFFADRAAGHFHLHELEVTD